MTVRVDVVIVYDNLYIACSLEVGLWPLLQGCLNTGVRCHVAVPPYPVVLRLVLRCSVFRVGREMA